MLFVLHNSNEVISKVTRRSIFLQNSFIHTSFQKNGDIDMQQIRSSDNVADVFTQALPTSTFKKLVHEIGMRRLKNFQ